MFLSKYIVFHVQKIKVNNSVVGCYAVKLIFYFSFFIFSPFQWLCYISCYVKNFLGGSHLFGDSVSIFKENTWKSYYRQLQVIIMSFNKKKTLVNISSISNSKNPQWNLLSFASRIVVNECLKTVCGFVLVLIWFQIIGNTIKTLSFQNTLFFDKNIFIRAKASILEKKKLRTS